MTAPNIPPEIDAFLAGHVDTVEQLEVLLLLHQDADRTWTAEDVAKVLYSHPGSVVPEPAADTVTSLYLIRLAAFVLILLAILDKNRAHRRPRQ